MIKRKATAFFLICVYLQCVVVTSGCARESSDDTVYISATDASAFADAVAVLLPGYDVIRQNRAVPDFARRGAVVKAYDAQIQSALADGALDARWYPMTLETIVITADRDRISVGINSWRDLYNDEAGAVSILNTAPGDRLAAAALSHGLGGRDNAVKLLAALHREKRLLFDDPTAPVRICFDSDAATRIKRGENIEIIIPAEGTLTFMAGLLSKAPLSLPSHAGLVLLDHGLRLADGSHDDNLYPGPDDYARAFAPDSFERINVATQGYQRALLREVLKTRLYSPADVQEHIIFSAVFLVIAVIWIGIMMWRSQTSSVRQAIFIIGVLLVCWVLTRTIRRQIDIETSFARYLWYSYYIFEAFLPPFVLRIATLTGAGSRSDRAPAWLYGLFALNLALVALVLTNDIHGLMFTMDLTRPGWSARENYGYGVVYYIVFAALILEVIASVVILFNKAKHSPRRAGVVFPIIFIVSLVIYAAGYAMRISFFVDSDLTMVICVFTLLFLELLMRVGQIPINTYYQEMFRYAGNKLQIVDEEGRSVFMSNDAEPLDYMLWERLKSGEGPLLVDDGTLLLTNKISGGYAVWQEDIAAINKLKADLEASNHELDIAYALLSGEARTMEQASRSKARAELYDAFQRDIASHERRLVEILSYESNDSRDSGNRLKNAALITCYIKRRSYMLSLSLDGIETVSFNEYVVFIDEMGELARLAGVECFTYCSLTGEISLRYATIFYDFWDSVLEWAVANDSDGVVSQTVRENERIVMKLLMSDTASRYEPPGQILDKARSENGYFDKKVMDNRAVLSLSFPYELTGGAAV